jgi:precorrin-6B methylase 1
MVSVGSRLSYPDEEIVTAPAEILAEQERDWDSLCAVLITKETEE